MIAKRKKRNKITARVPRYIAPRTPQVVDPIALDSMLMEPTISEQQNEPIELALIAMDTAQVYLLNLEFVSGSKLHTISEENEYFLDLMALKLEGNPTLSIDIIGHTDNVGSRLSNQALSEERALSVYLELIKRGADETQINYYGEGESMPNNDNSSDENRASNRRVEFRMIYEK